MWPLPLDSKPSSGSQAGPSPPDPLAASTLSLAPGSKISSSAATAGDPTARTISRTLERHRMAKVLLRLTLLDLAGLAATHARSGWCCRAERHGGRSLQRL